MTSDIVTGKAAWTRLSLPGCGRAVARCRRCTNYRPRIRNRCSWPLAIAEISISSMASLSSRAAY